MHCKSKNVLIYSAQNEKICTVKEITIMRKYDYRFLKEKNLPFSFLQKLVSIDTFRVKESELYVKFPELFQKLKLLAISQSVIASNAIEGIVTNEARIKELLENKIKPINHDENEILGYQDALNDVHLNYRALQFNERSILKLHDEMLSKSEAPHRGKFKTRNNAIVDVYSDGSRVIRFKPVDVSVTQASLEQCILAFIDTSNQTDIHPLLIIPCVILDFLCIHPFEDGNGRISRLLSLLLLYLFDYDFCKYISFENQINLHKEEYYEALKQSSYKWEENENDYNPFIQFFLDTIFRCIVEFRKRVEILNKGSFSKKERIKETFSSSFRSYTREEIVALWPDISIDTVKKVLLSLQKEDIIEKIGTFKDAKYRIRN